MPFFYIIYTETVIVFCLFTVSSVSKFKKWLYPTLPPTLTSDLEKSQNWLLKKWHVQSSPWRRHCWLRKRFDESLKIIAETFQFLCSLPTKKTAAQKFLPKLLFCAISLFWFSPRFGAGKRIDRLSHDAFRRSILSRKCGMDDGITCQSTFGLEYQQTFVYDYYTIYYISKHRHSQKCTGNAS